MGQRLEQIKELDSQISQERAKKQGVQTRLNQLKYKLVKKVPKDMPWNVQTTHFDPKFIRNDD